MIEKKVLKKALFDLLDLKFKPIGFKKKLTMSSFFKESDKTKQCIGIDLAKRYGTFEISLHFALRINVLDDLDEKYLDKTDIMGKERKDLETYTLGCDAGHLVGKRNDIKIWYANTEDDMYAISEEIFSIYQIACVELFERYTDLEILYELLCSHDRVARKFCAIAYVRALKAILLSYILKKPNILDLIAEKKQIFEKKQDLSLQFFCEFLERFSNDVGLDIKHLL